MRRVSLLSLWIASGFFMLNIVWAGSMSGEKPDNLFMGQAELQQSLLVRFMAGYAAVEQGESGIAAQHHATVLKESLEAHLKANDLAQQRARELLTAGGGPEQSAALLTGLSELRTAVLFRHLELLGGIDPGRLGSGPVTKEVQGRSGAEKGTGLQVIETDLEIGASDLFRETLE